MPVFPFFSFVPAQFGDNVNLLLSLLMSTAETNWETGIASNETAS